MTQSKLANSRNNVQKSDQMIAELNSLRNKGFLFLTEKERKRFKELMKTTEKKAA